MNAEKNSTKSKSNLLLNLFKNQWIFLLVVIIIISVTTGIVNQRFFSGNNVMNILEQIAVLGILASGMTMLIASGEIDISIGANVGIVTCVIAILIKSGMGIFFPVMIGISLAMLNSLLVGATSIFFKAPSFIVSLAFISVFQGLALAITKGSFQTIYGQFEVIGATRLGGFLPLSFVISMVAYLVAFFILYYTKMGRRIYSIGSNPSAAYLSGISVKKAKLSTFLINGVFVGVAAMVLLSRIGAAQPSTGSGMELKTIGAVVIGGTPLMGGKASVVGTFFGVLLMGVISNSLNMLRVNPYYQEVTFGALIIGALGISLLSSYRKKAVIK